MRRILFASIIALCLVQSFENLFLQKQLTHNLDYFSIEKSELFTEISNEDSTSLTPLISQATTNDFLVIDKSVDSTSISSGEIFVYTIQYSCASTTFDCQNVMIVDTLPASLNFESFIESPIHSNSTTYDATSHSVTFNLNKQIGTGIMAGSTGEVKIRVSFPNGSTPNNTIAENFAVMSADNANTSNSDTIATTAIATSGWEINKSDAGTIRLDTDFSYSINVNDILNGSSGSLNLDTFTIIDTLPADVNFISANNGGVYDALNNTVTWAFGSTAYNTNQTTSVTVNFPTGTFAENETVINKVSLYGQPVGEPYGPLGIDQVSHNIQPPVPPAPEATLDKNLIGANSFIIGDTLNWELDLANTGNTALDTFTLIDTLPILVEVVELTTGTYTTSPISLNIYYQTNLNSTFLLYPGSPFDGVTEQSLNVDNDLTLAVNEYISILKYEFGTVPEGFANSNDINIYTAVLDTDHNGNPVAANDIITNEGVLYFEYEMTPDGVTNTDSGTVRDTLPAAVTIDKSNNSNTTPIGGELNWYMVASNAGDYDLDSIAIIDTLPPELGFVYTESGGWLNLDTDVEVYYQTNLNSTYQAWTNSPYAPDSDTQLYASSLGLGATEYVTIIKWVFRNPKRGFTHDGNRARVRGTLLEIDRNGNTVTPGLTVENCIYMTGYLDGISYTSSDRAEQTILEQIVEADPDKFIIEGASQTTSGGNYFPGDIIEYQITAQNNSVSTDTMTNPILVDLLPASLSYVDGSQAIFENAEAYPTPIFEKIENYNSTGQTMLRWSWTGAAAAEFLIDTEVVIRYQTVLGPDVKAGDTVTNIGYQTSNDTPTFSCDESEDLDAVDYDGDGLISDLLCKDDNDVTFTILEVPSLTSEKLVRGQLDTVFTKFPNSGKTVPGGDVEYKLNVENDGTVPMTNVVLIDILPFVGDMGVIDLSGRSSRWKPNLAATINVPSGVTIYYSTEGNPCRSAENINPSGPAGCNPPNWSIIPPTDLSTVQSFKVDFGSTVINPGDKLTVSWNMKSPVNVLDGLGGAPDSVAWNSFGYIGNRINTDGSVGSALLPAEPVKVGIGILPPEKGSYGNFVWEDSNQDGDQDAGESGIDGVRVELFLDDGDGIPDPATDSLVAFTLTADGGFYLFPELDPADYFAVFYKPVNYLASPNNVAADNIDSDGIAGEYNGFDVGITAVTTISDAEQDLTWDYGVYPDNTATLGNYVWYDVNEDGIQNEATSYGLNDIPVQLFDDTGTLIDSTTTTVDINGNPGWYQFDSLIAGDYYVEFSIPASFDFTTALHAGGTIDQTDSDAIMTVATTLARTDTLTLAAGDVDYSWDAGLILPSGQMSLGNFVWNDVNNDGDYDPATEAGINGVTVNLYEDTDGNGIFTPNVDAFLATTNTQVSGGVSGHYLFSDLPEGNFIVQLAHSNFENGGILKNYSSSTGNGIGPDPDNDLNFDDNGEPMDGYGIVSQAVSLNFNTEPTNDQDTDTNSNLTVDFGVFLGSPCGIILSNLNFGECNEINGISQIVVDYNLNWYNVPSPAEDIILNLGGIKFDTLNIAATSNGGQIITDTIPADGSTGDLIAHFQSDPTCGDTLNYTVNNGCPFQLIKTADTTIVDIGDTVTYSYTVINNSSEIITLDSIYDDKIGTIETTVAGAMRVSDSLQVYYRFEDMNGNTISDLSGNSPSIDLTLENANYTWGVDSTLEITAANRAVNTTNNTRVYSESLASNQLTVEAWVTPANNTQGGAARMVTQSTNSSNRNFQLMQNGNDYEFRLHAGGSTKQLEASNYINGTPSLQHVIYTYDGSTAKFYIDGVEAASATYNANFSWDSDYDFAIGNEFNSSLTSRDWLGKFHLVSVYSKAFTAAEVTQNYTAGLSPEIQSTIINPGDTVTITADYEVKAEDAPGPLVNIASVSGKGEGNNTLITSDRLSLPFPLVCDISNANLTNVICNDNGSNADATDDFISFNLNPTGTDIGSTYNVTVSSGTITPSSANYGAATLFQLQNGSAGAGDVTVTITDDNDASCTLDILVNDSGPCEQNIDYPDYNDPDNPCASPACHIISSEIFLGNGVSSELATLSDTLANSDIDDGISILPKMQFTIGNTINLPVSIYNNTASDAYLRIWIDWNGDGDFEDAGEQVENNTYPSTGTALNKVHVSIAIPKTANQTKQIALRARLSTDDINSATPCGTGTCAADGEVEDYLIEVECPAVVCPPVQLGIKN